MKPKPEDYVQAVEEMRQCKYFPGEPGQREMTMELVAKFCDRLDGLRWLVDVLVNYVGEWPGPAQLRALYATRYRPADGIEGPHCTIAGFTPVDSERASLEGHENLKIEERNHKSLFQNPLKRLQ